MIKQEDVPPLCYVCKKEHKCHGIIIGVIKGERVAFHAKEKEEMKQLLIDKGILPKDT